MANIVVDIGNTALKAAWAEGMTLGKTFRYQGERTVEFILSLTARQKPDILAISSVRQLSERDIQRLEAECGRLVLIDSAHPDIVRAHGFPAYISPDRAAGLIAARYLFKGRGCTVFDLGTTLTVDFLESDGKYAGGNISPGCSPLSRFSPYRSIAALFNIPVNGSILISCSS